MSNAKTAKAATASATQFDAMEIFRSASIAIFNGVNAIDIIKSKVKDLRDAGIKFGASKKTCLYRRQFGETMANAFTGKSEKTYSNYITAFVAAVNDGIEFSLSHSKGKAGNKGNAQKAGEKTDADKMLSALLNVWKLSDVAEECLIRIETLMANDMPLIDAIENILDEAGLIE